MDALNGLATDDPRIRDLYVEAPADDWLCISFESSNFHKQWEGIMEYHFRTKKALALQSALLDIGARGRGQVLFRASILSRLPV